MEIVRLEPQELRLIRPLLLDLLESEVDPKEAEAPSRDALDSWLPRTRDTFKGENHVFAARERDRLVGFCWCVIFDPGTGLEGEVAELYLAPEWRGRGLGDRLVEEAVGLFRTRRVTFACVWTKEGNRAALSAYRRAGFAPTDQLVLTWYPS
ncbi:MAG: GNAT family N-acetyltransferase [Candidatus Dormibacteria bacterium]